MLLTFCCHSKWRTAETPFAAAAEVLASVAAGAVPAAASAVPASSAAAAVPIHSAAAAAVPASVVAVSAGVPRSLPDAAGPPWMWSYRRGVICEQPRGGGWRRCDIWRVDGIRGVRAGRVYGIGGELAGVYDIGSLGRNAVYGCHSQGSG